MIIDFDSFRETEEHSESDYYKSAQKAFFVLFKEIQSPNYKKIILMCGIPGSGKSTYAQKLDLKENGNHYLIWDVTAKDKVARAIIVQLGRAFNKPVYCYYIKTDPKKCIEQIKNRKRQVPDDFVQKCHEQITNDPPTEEEGFTKIVIVTNTDIVFKV